MKKLLTAKTRREFFISNIVGVLIVLLIVIWLLVSAFQGEGMPMTSFAFWIAIILIVISLPLASITIFSAMKSVVVTEKGLVIAYVFKKHVNTIDFSEVKDFWTNVKIAESTSASSSLKDSFKLTLSDGRVFEFSRTQLDNYAKLKTIVKKKTGS